MDPMPSRAARTAYVVLTVSFLDHRGRRADPGGPPTLRAVQDASTLTLTGELLRRRRPASPRRSRARGTLPVYVDLADPSPSQRVIATVPVFVWWALGSSSCGSCGSGTNRRERGSVQHVERHQAAAARRALPGGLPARDDHRGLFGDCSSPPMCGRVDRSRPGGSRPDSPPSPPRRSWLPSPVRARRGVRVRRAAP